MKLPLTRLTPLLLAASLGGCGLGTEIGNGVKDDGQPTDGGAGKKTSAPGRAGDTAPVVASEKESQADKMEMPADSAQGGVASSAGGAVGGAEGTAAVAFAPNMLFTSCASPFAELPHTALVLKADEFTLKADWVEKTDAAPAHWRVKDGQDATLAIVELDPPVPTTKFSVMVFDAKHEPLADKYTCGPADGRMVPLFKDEKPYTTLSWTFRDDKGEKLAHIDAAGVVLVPQE